MSKCWASLHSECSGKISREHLISQSTFRGVSAFEHGAIRAYGMPWNEKGIIEIKYTALASKILCIKHNGDMSKLDAEAGRVAEVFRNVEELLVRAKTATKQETVKFSFSGNLFERWFLKTYINFHSLYFPQDHLPKELGEIVFGERKFPDGVGLATVGRAAIGLQVFGQDMKYVQIVNSDTGGVEYVLFQYFGINYLLPLTDQPMPTNVMSLRHLVSGHSPIDELIENIQGGDIYPHLKGLDYQFGDHVRVVVSIDWS